MRQSLKPTKNTAAKHSQSERRRPLNNFLQVAGILPILVAICILFALLSPNFLSTGNVVNTRLGKIEIET